MAISFIRVDDRIVHGQITTRWAKEVKCDGVVAVNDVAANNPALVAAFKSCMDKPVFVMTYKEFTEKNAKILASDKQYFLITKEPKLMAKILVDDKLPLGNLKRLVVGPQNDRPGTIEIGLNQSVLPEEGESFEKIHQAGYEVLFALVPEVAAGTWAQNRSKFGYK